MNPTGVDVVAARAALDSERRRLLVELGEPIEVAPAFAAARW